jgi:hypothetical protein
VTGIPVVGSVAVTEIPLPLGDGVAAIEYGAVGIIHIHGKACLTGLISERCYYGISGQHFYRVPVFTAIFADPNRIGARVCDCNCLSALTRVPGVSKARCARIEENALVEADHRVPTEVNREIGWVDGYPPALDLSCPFFVGYSKFY